MLETKIVKLRVIYQLYCKELNDKTTSLYLSNRLLEKNRDNYLKLLNKHKTYINQCYDKTFAEIIALDRISVFRTINNIAENPLVNIYLEKVITCNRKISVNTVQIKVLEKKIPPYNLYSKILHKFNDKIMTEVAERNYFFCPMVRFGAIAVVRTQEKGKQRINWNKSNKKKEALIKAGLIPYSRLEHDKAKDAGVLYHGIKWLIKYPIKDYFYNWYVFRSSKILNNLLKDYRFKPARSRNSERVSAVQKLQKVKNDPEKADCLYTRRINYSKDVQYQAS